MAKTEHIDRKLAAIMAADVVGYSRLMGADEVGTLRSLKAARREYIDPAIAAHGGRIVKTTGDGLLADFPSVVEAVGCAVAFQRDLIKRNADVAEDKRVVFRVGINIGDVIIEGKDIFGDGVNIAARLESICEPGGLCISETARDQVRDKLPLTFVDLGEQQVKNIARPVRVFGLAPQAIAEAPELSLGLATPSKPLNRIMLATALVLVLALAGAAAWWATHRTAPSASQTASAPPSANTDVRPSIAVLPLVTLSDATKEDYFADGMTEDIISALGRFPEFTVRSSNAVFAYKGKTPKPDEVGRALDVRYIVEGSIRRSPERIRISIRLTAADRGTQLWSENYDVAPKDIFSVQDDITRRIAGTLASRLTNLELAKAATKPPSSMEAYDLVLRGRELYGRVNRTANSQARALFKRATELDPAYAPSYIGLGRVELNGVMQGWTADPDGALQRAENLGQKAISIDATSAGAHALLGAVYLRYADYDRALDEMRRAVELNNSDPEAYAGLATALLWSGDVDASVKDFEIASKLGLNFTVNESFILGIAYLLAGRNADAIRTVERSLERNKTDPYTNAVLAAAYALAGRQDDAARQAATVRQIDPRFDTADFGTLLRNPELRAKLVGAMEKAGL
ncbi:MAG: adenylate/guanylate cyclase domain-containing protein [Pseudolabrys sp.]